MPGEERDPIVPIPSKFSYDPTIITKSISAALSVLDSDFRIVWINKVLEKWFRPLCELKGRHCYEVYERRRRICPGCPALKVFKYGLKECVSLRRNIIIKDKGKRHVKLTTSPIRDEEGRIVQVLELVEDVTEQLNAQKEAKKKLNFISRELNFMSALDREFICSREVSLEKVFKQCVNIAPALLGADAANLRLVDSAKKILTSRASKGLSKPYSEKTVMEIGEGIAGKVALTKEAVVIKDILGQKDLKFLEFVKKEGIRSLVCVPIMLKKEILGTLTVYDKKMEAFTKDDQNILMNFANHITILLDNLKIRKKIFTSYINTIKSLVSAVEARDAYTRGHSEKVTKFSMDIANVLELPKEERAMLAYCGRLHDIGKIAISDAILNKRGRLTSAEMAEIQMHPVRGVEILSNLKFLEKGMSSIKHHHERYDGNGYPEGLKGREIPLSARIIGCADAFDAMTSDRSYRQKMDLDKALVELKVNKRKQFDPDIVNAFMQVLKNKGRK